MVTCVFQRGRGDVLIPADADAETFVKCLKMGAGVSVTVKKARNIGHHRKFFSLIGLAFDMWEPLSDYAWNGQPIRKDLDRFRKDILILAGYHERTFAFDGSMVLEAKSISFAQCDQVEFDKIYNAVLDVVWERVFREAHFKSKEEVENTINNLLSYGG